MLISYHLSHLYYIINIPLYIVLFIYYYYIVFLFSIIFFKTFIFILFSFLQFTSVQTDADGDVVNAEFSFFPGTGSDSHGGSFDGG